MKLQKILKVKIQKNIFLFIHVLNMTKKSDFFFNFV
jgi:hypothetical protein